jgi:hypothetical protein
MLRAVAQQRGDSNKAARIKRDFYPRVWENPLTLQNAWLRSCDEYRFETVINDNGSSTVDDYRV